jgi:N-glycosylase/DNA lyase
MREEFLNHYKVVEEHAKSKLNSFSSLRDASHEELFEEMAFCVFAANSSAKMGLLAVDLLRPVLHDGTLDDYKKCVFKKVRFYNKRAEYLFYNRVRLDELGVDLKEVLRSDDVFGNRLFIRDNFKGFGLKESSHFLRNTGNQGLCIIDKHILSVMKDLDVLRADDFPKRDSDYFRIEKKIKDFAEEYNLDVDVLDLAAWSFRTGEIIK